MGDSVDGGFAELTQPNEATQEEDFAGDAWQQHSRGFSGGMSVRQRDGSPSFTARGIDRRRWGLDAWRWLSSIKDGLTQWEGAS
ncbi:hypothetical protein ACJRO7_015347, partial [Eucalyptus globulus]